MGLTSKGLVDYFWNTIEEEKETEIDYSYYIRGHKDLRTEFKINHIFKSKHNNNIKRLGEILLLQKIVDPNKYYKIKAKYKERIESFIYSEYEFKVSLYVERNSDNKLMSIAELLEVIPIDKFISQSLYSFSKNYNWKIEIDKVTAISPFEYFDLARQMDRKFMIHVGGTNTGKTYQSIQRLKEAPSGVYLSPLRLLALEVQETLNTSGVKCNLLTGEERETIEDATHISMTVEMLDTNKYYDVAVIDECQMVADKWRGGNWVRAILGLLCPEIHICVAPEGLEIVKKLITDCGDTYEVFEHKRMTPLYYKSLPKDFNLEMDAVRGDAFIVFSRRSVLGLASELESYGHKVSVIYGALPYDTRKMQMQRFIDGETDLVVATDAIGMGLNLPIKRIIFMEQEKFDGENFRLLNDSEVKQIAGRAGRRGIYEEGYVSTVEHRQKIKRALDVTIPQIKNCYLVFPERLLDIKEDLGEILKNWYNNKNKEYFKKQSIEEILELHSRLKKAGYKNKPNKDLYALCTIPVDVKNDKLVELWIEYCMCYFESESINYPEISCATLEDLELSYKYLDLYYSFGTKMGMTIDEDSVYYEKKELSRKINTAILHRLRERPRKCRKCGKTLPWNYPYMICEDCYCGRIKERKKSYKGDKKVK